MITIHINIRDIKSVLRKTENSLHIFGYSIQLGPLYLCNQGATQPLPVRSDSL